MSATDRLTTRSAWLTTLASGRTRRWMPTDRDREYLRLLARWYCLHPGHLLRATEDPEEWEIGGAMAAKYPDLTDDERIKRATERAYSSVAKRLRYMAGNHPYPLAGQALMNGKQSGFWVTQTGARVAGLGWDINSAGVAPHLVTHAWNAADVGISLEQKGFRMLSEREIAKHSALDEGPVPEGIISSITRGSQNVSKRPDLAVVHHDGVHFVAVEIERDRNRALGVYAEKLSAYRMNTAVTGVLYVTPHRTTRSRILQAAEKVGLPPDFLTVAQLRDGGGYNTINFSEATTRMLADYAPVPVA